MYTADLEVLHTARRWFQEKHRVLLATVVRTWGSSPRPIGSMMVMRADGHVRGSVSGGCIEDDLILRLREGALSFERPFSTTYGLQAEDAHKFGLPCGGTLELLIEPIQTDVWLDQLISQVEHGALVKRTLTLATGEVALDAGNTTGSAYATASALVSFHGPRHRLLIIGAGQLSRYVAQFALALDYAVIVCDPREEFLKEWDVDGVQCSDEMPDDLILRLAPDARTAIVTLTHDPKLDDMALLEALISPAFYVGAVGSRRNNAERRERLAYFELEADHIDRLRGPIGLHLGAKTPPEIALAIMAEITAFRHHVPVLQTHTMRDDARSA